MLEKGISLTALITETRGHICNEVMTGLYQEGRKEECTCITVTGTEESQSGEKNVCMYVHPG